MATKTELNKAIRTVNPNLRMINNKGCCHFYSNDEKLGLYLGSADSTSIWVDHWSDYSTERWIEEATDIMKDFENYEIPSTEPVSIVFSKIVC